MDPVAGAWESHRRMTLQPLSIVLTAVGCPGASTLIRMLKANGCIEGSAIL